MVRRFTVRDKQGRRHKIYMVTYPDCCFLTVTIYERLPEVESQR